ncbi:Vi polysaccharide biosynthesis protein VipB-TviC [Marine Group I thaumarchaeote SCGC AAA799-B03]|uniref:Vi polysaccharide biosynthesis protein VipB-TviC n=1 Tax=Marine Group I thaumarchaeote SCGC AAA799-B03 TaxID=1502289 RepID=A0A087S8V0_9ARCH|nr:Vi polysaccharide biosynthesis protein VipB-TviC [Marine Group I thaumarchaeote SCGC AAA799-B03]
MKILVTGGAGFIGRHVVKSLLEKGHTVTIFDNFSNSLMEKILDLEENRGKIVKGDITNLFEIDNATKEIDIIIHLAAKISVNESVKNPSETFRVNVEGTRNVLKSCVKNSVKKIIVASSAAVYGESSPNTKITEESETNPISPYGESKLKMEQIVKEFALNHDINYVILRFFNIYGKGQSDAYAGVITKFMERIREDKPITIFGDGLQTRDFVAIKDVVDSIFNSMSSVKNGIYNIASGEAITINELADKMITLSSEKLKIEHLPEKKGDIRHSQADISLAKKELRFFPKFTLDKIKELL